jgi:outer membrane lipoprotein-sorting protein
MHRLLIGDPDELLLTVDAQRGVLLRTEARLAGTSYRIVEMDEVSFDEEFGPEVFAIHPPEGQDWKGPGRPGADARGV